MSDVRESIAAYGATVRKWTVAEYYRAAEKGIFKPGERLELIEGEVVEKVSPQKTPHATAVQLAVQALTEAFPEANIRSQLPLRIDEFSEPEPDVAVVRGSIRDYVAAHPLAGDVLLLVEVSDTTLRLDRERKATLYARSGVAELWVVNLGKRCVEVFRDPATGEGRGKYQSHEIVTDSGSLTPVNAAQAHISVASLLP